jgi:hypothetical protein
VRVVESTVRSGAVTLAVGFLLALALVRCQGESSFVLAPIDAGLPDPRYEAVCAAWARSRCACNVSFWVDTAQCIARETITCELLADDPNVPFDAAQVAACAEPDGGCFEGYDEYCIGPGRGRLGETCMRDEACESGYCALGFDPTSGAASPCGTCQLFPCKDGCPIGMSCVIKADGTGMCVGAVGGPGTPCASPNDCDVYSYCGPTGVCMKLPTIGQPCGRLAMGLPCGGPNLYCDDTGSPGRTPSNTCLEYSSGFAGYGHPCGLVPDTSPDASAGAMEETICQGAAACNLTGGGDHPSGICLAPAADGALCDDNQELGCLPPAQCIGNRCLFPSMSLCGGGASGH